MSRCVILYCNICTFIVKFEKCIVFIFYIIQWIPNNYIIKNILFKQIYLLTSDNRLSQYITNNTLSDGITYYKPLFPYVNYNIIYKKSYHISPADLHRSFTQSRQPLADA